MFFHPDLHPEGGVVELSAEESRHVAGARRLSLGDAITLFDGKGTVARACLEQVGRKGEAVRARVEAAQQRPRQVPALHLACALPKGDRQGVLLDMASQLGVDSFTPLLCGRSVVKAGANTRARLARIALEACKQSRQPYVPEIREPAAPDGFADWARQQGCTLWLAHPGPDARSLPEVLQSGDPGAPRALMVGPEGGFTDQEVDELLAAGGQAVSLGESVLRVETAGVALLAALRLCHQPGPGR